MKSQHDNVLGIIHSGQPGWNWKHGKIGKIYLLINFVFSEQDFLIAAAGLF